VRGTPTLFVNGEIYRGSVRADHLVEALETTAPATAGLAL
jgi:protein-disulfide isomerase